MGRISWVYLSWQNPVGFHLELFELWREKVKKGIMRTLNKTSSLSGFISVVQTENCLNTWKGWKLIKQGKTFSLSPPFPPFNTGVITCSGTIPAFCFSQLPQYGNLGSFESSSSFPLPSCAIPDVLHWFQWKFPLTTDLLSEIQLGLNSPQINL